MENQSQEKNNKRLIFMLKLDRTLPRDQAIQKLKTEGWGAFKKYREVSTKVMQSNQREQTNTHPVRCIQIIGYPMPPGTKYYQPIKPRDNQQQTNSQQPKT